MQRHFKYLGYYLLIFLLAFGMKYHYSRADSEQLGWILAPTVGMVELLSGVHFERESGEGYINYEHYLIIAPSCAGVNFLIAAFCMAGFSFLHLFNSYDKRLFWIFFSLFASYSLTIFVNAVRILSDIYLYQADFMPNWLSPKQAHRIEGIAVYFFFLSLYYLLLQKSFETVQKIRTQCERRLVNIFPPLFWYLCIALLVPLIHQAYRQEFQLTFGYVLSVSAICLGIFIFLGATKICCRKLLKVDKVKRVS